MMQRNLILQMGMTMLKKRPIVRGAITWYENNLNRCLPMKYFYFKNQRLQQ